MGVYIGSLSSLATITVVSINLWPLVKWNYRYSGLRSQIDKNMNSRKATVIVADVMKSGIVFKI